MGVGVDDADGKRFFRSLESKQSRIPVIHTMCVENFITGTKPMTATLLSKCAYCVMLCAELVTLVQSGNWFAVSLHDSSFSKKSAQSFAVPSGKKAVGRIQPSEPSLATSKEKKSQKMLSPAKHLPCVSAGTLIQVPNENRHLVGREDDVKILSQLLEKSRLVVVHGLPGIGKTSLAINLAHAVRNEYNGIAFIKCSSSSAFESSLTAICRSIDKSNVPESLCQSELLEYMKHWLTHDEKRKLLIFDGLRDVAPDVKDVSDKIEALLATESSNRPSCLFAARKEVRKIGNLRIEEVYDLKKLTEENVVDMLIERCEASRDDEEEVRAATEIAKLVKIPHLVDLTANAIKKKGVLISTYWKYMKLKGGFRVFNDTEEDLEAKQVYKDIISENASTKALRELLVVFALTDCPELVPVDLFAIGGNKLPDCALRDEYEEEKRSYRLSRDETADEANTICTMVFTGLLLELQKSHLISYDSKTGTAWMHSAISEEVLELAETESEWENCKPKRGLDILSSLLTTTFEADRTDKTPVYEALVPHTFRFIANMKRRQLSVSSRLQLNVGKMTSLLGRFKEAKDLLEKCKDLCEGENDDFRGKTLLHLGTVYRRLGYLPKAERLLREACEMWKQKGDSPVKLGEAKMAYAEVLMDASEFRKAYTLLKEIKEENVSDLGNYYGNMGWACYDLQKYRKAIERFATALEKSGHRNEYRHGLFIAYQRLAKAADFLKTYEFSTRSDVIVDEFESYLQECYEAETNVRAKRGPSHRYVAFLQRAISRLYLQLSQFFPTFDSIPVSSLTKAFRLALDSLESEIKILGKQHHKVAKSCDIIAQVCYSLRGYDIPKLEKCQTLALERAIFNCKKIGCDKFPAVEKMIEDFSRRRGALAEPQRSAPAERRPREDYLDLDSSLKALVKKATKFLSKQDDITLSENVRT